MNECQSILSKYSAYVPAIITPNKDIEICKRRFLFPKSENFGHCMANIRKHIQVKPSEAVFFFIDDKIINSSQNIGEFYTQYASTKKPSDAFLYISLMKENTFG